MAAGVIEDSTHVKMRTPEGPEAVVRLLAAKVYLQIARMSLQVGSRVPGSVHIGRRTVEIAEWCISPWWGSDDEETLAWLIHDEHQAATSWRVLLRDKRAKDIGGTENDAAELKQLVAKTANVAGKDDSKEGSTKKGSGGSTLGEIKNLGKLRFNFALKKKDTN